MEFNLKKIYLISSVVMLISSIGSLISVVISWKYLNFGTFLSSFFGGFIFQLLISIIFFVVYKQTGEFVVDNNSNKMNEIIDEVFNNEISLKGGSKKCSRKKRKDN